jgi:molybdenum cofactor cytidylyltransferase
VIAGLLLASGASRRFGSNKLLAPLEGRPVVRWSAEALASAVDATHVVVPVRSQEVRAALEGLAVHWVENAEAESGMASSIRAGVASLPADVEAVVITLGDQPLIDTLVIRRVVARWRETSDVTRAITTSYADGRGHPTLFGSAVFAALRALKGDRGARELIASQGDAVTVVEMDGPRPMDVDTPEALQAVARQIAARSGPHVAK